MSTLNIGTLRLRSGDGDRLALRLRTARALQAADLTPAGLPPASVLVVRYVRDPMPCRFGAGLMRPRSDWERAVRSTLETAARTARRPDETGRIDPASDALLFEDEAQALACLIVEGVRGRARSSWWWKALLSQVHLSSAVLAGEAADPASLLAMKPRTMPAAIACITRWREAAAVARACSIDGAKLCVAGLIGAYGLTTALAGDGLDSVESKRLQWPDSAGDGTRNDRASGAQVLPASDAWIVWVPREIERAGVPFEVQRLFGLALGLHQRTASVRETTIQSDPRNRAAKAKDLEAVEDSRRLAGALDGMSATGVEESSHQPAQIPPATDASAESDVAPASVIGEGTRRAAPGGLGEVGTRDRPGLHATGPASPELRRKGHGAVDGFVVGSAASAERTRRTGTVSLTAPERDGPCRSRATPALRTRTDRLERPASAARELPAAFSTEGVATRLGGVFYLIHALEALNLPAACERGWHVEAAAGPWGTLDVIARALMGGRYAPRDPIWEALAHLAGWPTGHSRDVPAAAVLSPHAGARDPAFAAPLAWPAALDDSLELLAWTATRERIWLWSNKGYLLAAGRTTAATRVAAERRARRLRAQAARLPADLTPAPPRAIPWLPPAALPRGCPLRLGRWAAAVAPAVLRRLQLALDASVESPRSRPPRARSVLPALEFPARLYVTSSHVDVVIPLQCIDLRVRRAGLDRDPGWLPSYGRVVCFHFE